MISWCNVKGAKTGMPMHFLDLTPIFVLEIYTKNLKINIQIIINKKTVLNSGLGLKGSLVKKRKLRNSTVLGSSPFLSYVDLIYVAALL